MVQRPHSEFLGAQIVAARAGEMIPELALAIDHQVKLGNLAGTIHVCPTYAVGIQQLAADVRLQSLSGSRVVNSPAD